MLEILKLETRFYSHFFPAYTKKMVNLLCCVSVCHAVAIRNDRFSWTCNKSNSASRQHVNNTYQKDNMHLQQIIATASRRTGIRFFLQKKTKQMQANFFYLKILKLCKEIALSRLCFINKMMLLWKYQICSAFFSMEKSGRFQNRQKLVQI